MENTMNKETKEFIEKLQAIGNALYEEYNQLNDGLQYTCPLTDVIDSLYEFSIMNIEDTIKPN